jgi:hypothetical protein
VLVSPEKKDQREQKENMFSGYIDLEIDNDHNGSIGHSSNKVLRVR